jgi:hypothetical protein
MIDFYCFFKMSQIYKQNTINNLKNDMYSFIIEEIESQPLSAKKKDQNPSDEIMAELDQIISQPAKCQLQYPPFDAKGFCFDREEANERCDSVQEIADDWGNTSIKDIHNQILNWKKASDRNPIFLF